MRKNIWCLSMVLCGALLLSSHLGKGWAAPAEEAKPDSRCEVCGMFVAKYPTWLTQIRHQDGTLRFFDGAKDMLAYYFQPQRYGGAAHDAIQEVWVKDYYTLEWLDGRQAFYVTGSDVYGPMGHELIPFSSRKAAEAFQKDHGGERFYSFDELTPELIESLRSGQNMKMDHHSMPGHGMNGPAEGEHPSASGEEHRNSGSHHPEGHQMMHH